MGPLCGLTPPEPSLRRDSPNLPRPFVQRSTQSLLKVPHLGSATRAISRSRGLQSRAERVNPMRLGQSVSLVGGGHRRGLVVARRAGADAAVAARRRREALLRVLCAVPRRADPARSRRPRSSLRRSRRIWPGWRKLTDCVRTYSIDFGLDRVPEIAAAPRPEGDAGALAVEPRRQEPRSRSRPASRSPTGIPDVIRAVVVGNEVLLRGEMSAADARRHHPRA